MFENDELFPMAAIHCNYFRWRPFWEMEKCFYEQYRKQAATPDSIHTSFAPTFNSSVRHFVWRVKQAIFLLTVTITNY